MAEQAAEPSRQDAPEIIVREQFMVDATGKVHVAIPELLLLANRAGYRWLADYFRDLAEREPRTHSDPIGDPDDHSHYSTQYPPVNPALSDRVELRIGHLDATNRDAVLAKYKISPETASLGSLVGRYRDSAERAARHEERR